MSNRIQTRGIILKRVNFGEADRIITLLTPDYGKVSAIAKGVRKPKSKLAGGIELLSICNIGIIKGRGEMGTLISTRLDKYFENIIKDYDRLQLAYDILKFIDKLTENDAEEAYYELLVQALTLLDDERFRSAVVGCWFYMQAMRLHGSVPELLKDIHGNSLEEKATYSFSSDDGGFFIAESGVFDATDIKAWRVFQGSDASQLKRVRGLGEPAEKALKVIQKFAEFQL